jgi:hypothetical protein
MLKIHYLKKDGQPVVKECVIRPVPFISISHNLIRNKIGILGSYYDITLTGTILPNEGSPYYIVGDGYKQSTATPEGAFIDSGTRPQSEKVDSSHLMSSIIIKQNLLRELLKNDGQKYELYPASIATDIADNSSTPALGDEPVLTFYPTVQSINFEEGAYVTSCKYTVNLRAEVLFDNQNRVLSDGLTAATFPSGNIIRKQEGRQTIDQQIIDYGGFIEDYSENWSLEVDEGKGTTHTFGAYDPKTHVTSIRTYRLTRNITATGRTIYKDADNRYEAWQQAKGFILKTVLTDRDGNQNNNSSGYEQYPQYTLNNYFASGILDLAKDVYGGYNHLRTESIDYVGGSYTISDTWLLSSGTAYEDYRLSLSRNSDDGITKVSIDGTIKGLSSVPASGTVYGGKSATPAAPDSYNTPHENARLKLHQLTNSGYYGPNCYLYKRASNATSYVLSHTPRSISINSNEFTGEITYNVEYDNRRSNMVTGTISENISYSDTYPGDAFAVIPVLGRTTGPILQYIGGRTEYQRNLNIELIFDRYYGSGTGDLATRIRQLAVLSKPSLVEPYRSDINSIISAYSPAREYGIRKYFLSPPSETWDSQSARYSLTLNWTYELDR